MQDWFRGSRLIDRQSDAGQIGGMMADDPSLSEDGQIHVRGEVLTPLPEGGLWWASERVLVVSDLHLEKGSSYAVGGQMLPPYDTSATLSMVEHLVETYRPTTLISLGDSFHDRRAETRLDEASAGRIRALTDRTDWVWVEGNHDPDPPAHLGGRAIHTLRIGGLVFRHEPTAELGEVSGHLHPVARVASPQRTLRRRCFVSDGQRLVMPAMGAFTGGLNVLHEAFDVAFPDRARQVYVMGAARIYPVSYQRLTADRLKSGGARRRMNQSRQAG